MAYDVIIIGRGPAGISAALYTKRAGLSTLVIGRRDSAIGKTSKIDNYYGFAETITGTYLLDQGEAQAARLGVEMLEDMVVSIVPGETFTVSCADRSFESGAIILATGYSKKKLNIPGLDDLEGRGVSYCTTCDGFFYRGLRTAVLGNKDYAVHEALELKAFTDKIKIFTNGSQPELTDHTRSMLMESANRHIMTDTRSIAAVKGGDALEAIVFSDGSTEELDGLFVAYESASGPDFAKKLGIMLEDNYIVTDRQQKTNLEGVFAAGDCTGGFKQISTAVGEGAVAGRSAIDHISAKKRK